MEASPVVLWLWVLKVSVLLITVWFDYKYNVPTVRSRYLLWEATFAACDRRSMREKPLVAYSLARCQASKVWEHTSWPPFIECWMMRALLFLNRHQIFSSCANLIQIPLASITPFSQSGKTCAWRRSMELLGTHGSGKRSSRRCILIGLDCSHGMASFVSLPILCPYKHNVRMWEIWLFTIVWQSQQIRLVSFAGLYKIVSLNIGSIDMLLTLITPLSSDTCA